MDSNGGETFILDSPEEGEDYYIPEHHEPQCCCGSVTCAFLRETQAAFDKLDESLRTAGRLGQALLVRHEAYVADAEAERKQMREQIDKLSSDKQYLQTQNSVVIEENRSLLEQLEAANSAVSDSDTRITSLTATLHSAQEELQKLNSLARRTETLERELEQFERDQAQLQASLAVKTEEERSATLRWQSAERCLSALEDRVEAIEREAREERERHVEIIGRMERRRAVEKELDTAATRLKGAAAVKSGMDKGGTGVVTHFVKDILQDNANLQMSMLEMRDLLVKSHEELERLREQMLQHSPPVEDVELTPKKPSRNLNDEMNQRRASEVHVHHHYHAPSAQPEINRRHSQTIRKPKKKRPGISFGHFTPPSGYQTPRHASVSSFGFPTPLSTATTLAVSSPSEAPRSVSSHRWSMQSSQPLSSSPSSPQSYSNSSVFDRSFSDGDTGLDSSRPTTPGTEIDSPFLGATSYAKRASGASFFRPLDDVLHEYESPDESSDLPADSSMTDDNEIQASTGVEVSALPRPEEDVDPEHSLVNFNEPVPRPRSPRLGKERPMSFTEDDLPANFGQGLGMQPLRRTASHESLLSVSGVDIHTLRTRPSQLLTGHTPRTTSTQPTVSATLAHAARPALAPRNSHGVLSGVSPTTSAASQGFGKRVSGWMFGRWNSSPAPTSAGTSLSNLNPARYTPTGAGDAGYNRQEITTLAGNRISVSSSLDDDDDLEGADFAEFERGGTQAEFERMLEDTEMAVDGEDGLEGPKRNSVEEEVARVLEENMKGWGVGAAFG